MAENMQLQLEEGAFEENLDAVISGINAEVDELESTQRKLGIVPRRKSRVSVVTLANGLMVMVDFSRHNNGSIISRKTKDGKSSLSFCTVTVIEPPKSKTSGNEILTQNVDYRDAYNRETGEWTMIDGAKMRLNYNPTTGSIEKNWLGTFAPIRTYKDTLTLHRKDGEGDPLLMRCVPVITEGVSPKGNPVKRRVGGETRPAIESITYPHSKIVHNQDTIVTVTPFVHENYYSVLTTKTFNPDTYKLEEDAKVGKYRSKEAYNALLDRMTAGVYKHLMGLLPEDASDALVKRAEYKARHMSKVIASQFNHCADHRSERTARILKLEGTFRIFAYHKEDARGNKYTELTTKLPNKEVKACKNCKGTDVSVYKNDEGIDCYTCGDCGADIEGKPNRRFIEIYEPNDRGFRAVYDVINDKVIGSIEAAIRKEMGIKSTHRFTGTCENCASCSSKLYGQNQELPGVKCRKGMFREVVLDQHWQTEEKRIADYVGYAENLLVSEAPDEMVGLYPAFHGITFDDGGLNLDRTQSYTMQRTYPDSSGDFASENVDGRLQWRKAKDRRITFPSFDRSDESLLRAIKKIAEFGIYPHSTIIKAPVPVKLTPEQFMLMHSPARGNAAYEVPKIGFETLSYKYACFMDALAVDVGTRDLDGLAGDYLNAKHGCALIEQYYEILLRDNDHDIDSVVDMVKFTSDVLDHLHPLFKSIVLEEGTPKSLYDMYPTVYRDMQIFVLGESTPRQIKAGKPQDMLHELAGTDTHHCIEWTGEYEQDNLGTLNFGAVAAN